MIYAVADRYEKLEDRFSNIAQWKNVDKCLRSIMDY